MCSEKIFAENRSVKEKGEGEDVGQVREEGE